MKLLIVGYDGFNPEEFAMTMGEPSKIFSMKILEPRTGPSWATIYTGLQTYAHRVDHTWGMGQGKYLLAHECIWDALMDRGFYCEMFNLPVTFPPHPVKNGWMVSGGPWFPMFRKEKITLAYPPEVQNKIPTDYIRHSDPLCWDSGVWKDWAGELRKMSKAAIFDKVKENVDFLTHLFYQLHEPDKADFAFIQYGFIDRLFHLFFDDRGFKDALAEIAKQTISTLVSVTNAPDLILLSDHGIKDEKTHTDTGLFYYQGKQSRNGMVKTNQDVKDFVLSLFLPDEKEFKKKEEEIVLSRMRSLGYV